VIDRPPLLLSFGDEVEGIFFCSRRTRKSLTSNLGDNIQARGQQVEILKSDEASVARRQCHGMRRIG